MIVFPISLYFSALILITVEKLYAFEMSFCSCVSISLSFSLRSLQGKHSMIICQDRALGHLHFFLVYLYTLCRWCYVKVKREAAKLTYCYKHPLLLKYQAIKIIKCLGGFLHSNYYTLIIIFTIKKKSNE